MIAPNPDFTSVPASTKLEARDLNVYYGNFHAIKEANLERARALRHGADRTVGLRQVDVHPRAQPDARSHAGRARRGKRICSTATTSTRGNVDPVTVRHRIGMVFQRPNPFPKTIFENVVFGPNIHGERDRRKLMEICEKSLRGAALWEEVKDRLDRSALDLSGGQQQRFCIARCLAVDPEVILMDEPASALDPIATSKIEDLIEELKKEYTVVIVTHSMQQAARISDSTTFFLMGDLIESGATSTIFTKPRDKRTEDYITGRYG